MDWKRTIFGNPFKKSRKSSTAIARTTYIEPSDGSYGVPEVEPEDIVEQEKLSKHVFNTRQEAADAYKVELRKIFYRELFYTIMIRCPNCRIEGVVRLERGSAADGAECPRCEVPGLLVIGVGDDTTEAVLYTPRLDEDTENTITEQVQNAVEHAWSIGRIKRGGIFED